MNRILANRFLAGPITREEQSDGTVVYKDMALIDHGVWTDSGSGEPTEYDPAELDVVEDNVLNIAHDADNEVSAVGHIEADSYYAEDGTGYANIVLDMDSPASEYADENLQAALESNGQVGFGGPSIEIPAGAYDLEEGEDGYPKLVNGEIHGAGLVMDPASKSTSFARQTAERGVALSSGEEPNSVWLKDEAMSGKLDLAALREQYNLSDDVDADTIKELAEAGALSLEYDDKDKEKGEHEDEEEDEEDRENEDEEYDEDEDEEMAENMDIEEVVSMVQAVRERMDELEEEHDALMQASDMEAELSEATEELRQDLAAADTVKELKDAKEDLDKRLSALEDEPKDPKSLSDNGDNEDVAYSPISPSQSRGY